MIEEIEYCYLVEHPTKGMKVFYTRYSNDTAASLAVDYAENSYPVVKQRLHSAPIEQDLSQQFNSVVKANIELPAIPVEAVLCSLG